MRFVALLLIALTSVAHADTSVAVVATGAASIQKPTRDVVEVWFRMNGLEITKAPLPKDGLNTLLNCLVISDMTCARGVIEARAKADNVIALTGQVSGKGDKRSVQLSAYWIAKHHEVVSLQRTCDACTDAVFEKTLDAMLDDLAKLAPTMGGHIHVTSEPSGMPVTVDNDSSNKTPFDRDIGYGPHVISVMRDGRVVAQKKITIKPEAALEVPLTVPAEPKVVPRTVRVVEVHHSRAMPVVVLTVGLAASITGVVLYRYGGPTGENYTYRNMRPAAIATGISGGVAVIIGGIWLLRGGSTTSHPEVSVTSSTTTIGWARSF